MSLQAIIDQCVTTTQSVSGIGVVRGHERFVNTRKGLETHFVHEGVINACEIDRASTPANRFSNMRTERAHELHFHFYYGLSEKDDTRLVFRAIVEEAEALFRNDYRLGGTAKLAGPFQIEIDAHIDKCGVLLHYVRASLVAKEELS